jgi:hypothetical protein
MVEGIGRTDEEIRGAYIDFGTMDPEVARRSFNFIRPGQELNLAALTEICSSLGYYASDISQLLNYTLEFLPSIEGRSRWEELVAISEKASARAYQKLYTYRDEELEKEKR